MQYGFLFCLSILKAGDPTIIQWAVKSDMVEICCTSIAMGNELTKVVRTTFLSSPLLWFYFEILLPMLLSHQA